MGTTLRRPKEEIWASDATYTELTEPWHGDLNKIEYTPGFIAEGFKPADYPDCPEFNWWRYYVSKFLEFISGIQLLSWKPGDFTNVTLGTGGWCATNIHPRTICYDDSNECFTAVDAAGETIYSYDPTDGSTPPSMGGQGLVWENETTNPRTLGYQVRDLACNNNGQRIAIEGNSLIMMMISTALNTWNTQAAASSVVWKSVDHDHNGGLWAIGGASGAINTSPNGTTWTARTSGVSNTIETIKHNQETGDDARWVALTNTETLWSSDGITWSYASHGLTSAPLHTKMAYNKESKRWILLLTNEDIAYSDNQGQTWTQVSDPFGLGSVTLDYSRGYIDSDGQDGWIFHYCPDLSTSIRERHISKDNGATWHRSYVEIMHKGAIKWGTDRFVSVGRTDCSYSIRLLGE